MKTNHVGLWQRLEQFQLDSAEAALPFSARLARENNWPAAHTRRVIAEYKRFAFLAVAAGHPVSPSEDVDQAWHLHLTYSQNYWKVFCPEILGHPLHHQPTQGGSEEREKFGDWYRKTLESYRACFGEEPPRDIWPTPETRAAEKHEFIRVDRERNWVIPKPARSAAVFAGGLRAWVSLLAGRRAGAPRTYPQLATLIPLGLLTVCCSGAMLAQGANPFDWRGPDFIIFYLVLVVVCFGFAAWLRWKLRQPVESPPTDLTNLDPYAIAYLSGGRVLAVNAAIANLANQKLLLVDAKGGKLTSAGTIPAEHHPLERAIHSVAELPGGETIKAVREGVKPAVERISAELKECGLVVADGQAQKAVWYPLLIAAVAPALGGIKILIGLNRYKPVEILVVLCIASVVALLIGFARRPLRSRLGDAVLTKLKDRHAELWRPGSNAANLGPAEFAMVIGLFGMTALAGTELKDLNKALTPPGGGGGCGSSCGGGCGGGGGGGGCGGCGGD